MFKASIGTQSYEVDFKEEIPFINGEPLSWDLKPLGNGHFHILYNQKSYNAEVVRVDKTAKSLTLKINGQTLTVGIKSQMDLMLEKMGMANGASAKAISVKAPMPGLIVKINVEAGQTVKAGDALLVLEAMKMENIIKAAADGTVKNIKITKGASVEKGQVLVEF